MGILRLTFYSKQIFEAPCLIIANTSEFYHCAPAELVIVTAELYFGVLCDVGTGVTGREMRRREDECGRDERRG